MLISFSVKNWMCFKDEVKFDMVAGDLKDHKDRLIKLKDRTNLIPIAAIYGKNGAGKTALFMALDYAVNLALHGHDKESYLLGNFYDKNTKLEFTFEFFINNKNYILNLTSNKDGLLNKTIKIKNEENNRVTVNKKDCGEIFEFFKSIIFITRVYNKSEDLLYSNKEIVNFIENKLNDLLWSLDFKNKIINKNYLPRKSFNKYEYLINNITIDGKDFPISWDHESSGLKWIVFHLLPFLYQIHCMENNKSKPAIFIIDGFEDSMHPVLTKAIIEAFLNNCNAKNRTQLIFTTHDTQFIDKEILRTDEILILDRECKSEESTLCALYDYQGSYSGKYLKENYLIGRFGGIPNTWFQHYYRK